MKCETPSSKNFERVLRWPRQSVKARIGGSSEPIPVRLYGSQASSGLCHPGLLEVLVRGHASPPRPAAFL